MDMVATHMTLDNLVKSHEVSVACIPPNTRKHKSTSVEITIRLSSEVTVLIFMTLSYVKSPLQFSLFFHATTC
jgi:hypothetical protein